MSNNLKDSNYVGISECGDVEHLSPLVSVVIPVYNGSNYLHEAIDSAIGQTYSNIEIIVVDDGSTDDTWDIIQSYGDKIRGFHKENGGVSSALNMGIQNMHGEWFAWLSHDDLWVSNKIEMQIHYVQTHKNINLCYSGTISINEGGTAISKGNCGVWYPRGKDIRKMLVSGNYISGITPIIHRACFQNVGIFREDLRYGQDLDMWIRIMCEYNLGLLPEMLAMGRVHSAQVGVRMSQKCSDEYKSIIRCYLNLGMLQFYYPGINYASISKIKYLILQVRCSLFLLYAYIRMYCFNPIYYFIIQTLSRIIPSSIKKIIGGYI